MSRIFRPNPNSLVALAVAQAGGPSKVATAMGLNAQTVSAWVKNDRIPNKHVLKLAHMGDLHPLDLIAYIERRKKPWFFKSPKKKPNALETLMALRNAEITLSQATDVTGVPIRSLKQTLTIWGDRLELLKDTLESSENKEVKAARLGVTVRQLNRLITAYLPQTEKADLPYKVARKRAKDKWANRRAQAVKVIRGDSTVVAAAEAIQLSERQMHRWMDKTLGEQFNMGLQEIRPLPKPFRNALAEEVEHDHPEAAAHMISYWKQHDLKRRPFPKTPESWKRETIRRCLIGLLTGEVGLADLCTARETDKRLLVPLLTGNLVLLGVSFEQAGSWSIHHQEALAEVLNSTTLK
jgi:hypothetical protein